MTLKALEFGTVQGEDILIMPRVRSVSLPGLAILRCRSNAKRFHEVGLVHRRRLEAFGQHKATS
jgi:hypothetical protein